MTRGARSIVLLGFCCVATLMASVARAECGGQQECIGISTDPTVPPEHSLDGVNHPAPTLDFGSQAAGTTSASRTILVAGVEGPLTIPPTLATLTSINLTGANASDFRITGGTCTTGTPTLVQDGNRVAQIANACTILVTFNPAAVGVKTAQVNVSTTAITRVAPLTGTGTPSLTGPSASNATLAAPVNTASALDLAPFITGTVTGVSVVTAPSHGAVTVSGTRVTYTPAHDYFGADSFTYAAFNSAGSSQPATVAVSVTGRPDPTTNADVVGLLRAQAQTARRFSRAQISNYQARLEALHRGGGPAAGNAPASYLPRQPEGLGSSFDPAAQAGLRTQPAAGGTASQPGFLQTSFANALLGAATTRTLNLGASSERGGGSSDAAGTGVWIGGNARFGTRDQTSDSSSLRFSTDGLSAGVDRRFGERLALGFGVGHARDATAIGSDGSRTRATGSSLAVYGSYQPSANTFVDGLLGYGTLGLDTDRYVAAANAIASGHRKGDQWFGSIAAGYEYRDEGLLLSPYGRLDFARDRLKQYSESGAGQNALTYFEQTLPGQQLALGLRAESVHETDFGWALPRLRVEFKHDFKGEQQASLAYADLFAGPTYSITPTAEKRNSLLLGIGSDFIFHGGLKLAIDYQVQRLSGVDHSQAVRVWLAQEFDGKGFSPGALSPSLSRAPVRVEAGVAWDDNVNRASGGANKLSDRIYSLTVGKSKAFPLGDNTRFVAAGFVNGDKFAQLHGLDRFSGGGQGEFQYRSSGDFGAPTLGLFGRATLDEYAGQLRSGQRYALGVSYRQSLTDRIEAFGALARNTRHADNSVFDGRDTSARFNLDYALGPSGTLYVGGEHRRGDVVSSMPPPAGYAPPAKAEVVDDAFGSGQFTAYRLEAKTLLWTLGYNLPLGARDSLDFSARHVRSTPTDTPAGGGTNPSYLANQYSAAYLMRF